MTLMVVIPARNEARRLGAVLDACDRVVASGLALEVLVVDDASEDATGDIARAHGCAVLRRSRASGYGGAVRAGCDEAWRRQAEKVVVLDADGQHRPEDIPAFVAELESAQVAKGTRSFDGQMPVVFRLGNLLLDLLMLVLFGLHVHDSQCGMFGFTRDAYPQLRWHAMDYAMSSERMVRVARSRLRYAEVAIPTIYLDRDKGTRPSDGLRILRQMMLWRFRMPRPAPVPAATAVA